MAVALVDKWGIIGPDCSLRALTGESLEQRIQEIQTCQFFLLSDPVSSRRSARLSVPRWALPGRPRYRCTRSSAFDHKHSIKATCIKVRRLKRVINISGLDREKRTAWVLMCTSYPDLPMVQLFKG